jgi:glutathione S-transferase
MSERCWNWRAKTVATEPVLYSFRRCPYAMRARLALAVSEVCYELREVSLAQKPAAMLAASPKGTVPVLVLGDGSVIDESLPIMRWALARNDPEGWLQRDDRDLVAACDGQFKANLDRYKYPDRFESDALHHRDCGLQFLMMLDGRLADAGHLCGSKPGLADAAIMPFVRQFAAVDPIWFEVQPVPHVKAWLAGQIGSALFQAIMLRVSPWSPGAAPVAMPMVRSRIHRHMADVHTARTGR